MADIASELPIRTQLPGQANYDDVIVKLGDATNPATQQASVDTHGSVQSRIADASGSVVTSQTNGAQRALDVGINVAGVQIDPRSVGQFNTVLPTVTSGSNTPLQTNASGVLLTAPTPDLTPATQSITAADVASTSTVSGAQTFITGSATAGSTASFSLSSNETAMFETTGTWSGTLQTEISVDGGTTWIAHSVHLISSPLFQTTFTANFIGSMNVAAKTQVRVRATTAWTGTATIRIVESANASSIYVANAIKLVDSAAGSTTQASIVAATVVPTTAGNTAIVVSLRDPLPAGTALIGSVNQGTSPWIVKDQADGPVAPGAAATFSQLIGVQFNTALPTLTNGQQAAAQADANGRLFANVTNLPTTVDTNFGTVGASTIRVAAEIGNATGAANFGNGATGAQTLRVAANLAIAGADVTATNPIPVAFSSAPLGTIVNDYNTVASIAAGATSNHNYTITATKTFQGKKIWAAASGLMKIEVQVSPDGTTFPTKWVGFNSTANPNITIDLDQMVFVDSGTGAVIRVIRTNLDKKAQDVYSTISGTEV